MNELENKRKEKKYAGQKKNLMWRENKDFFWKENKHD